MKQSKTEGPRPRKQVKRKEMQVFGRARLLQEGTQNTEYKGDNVAQCSNILQQKEWAPSLSWRVSEIAQAI